MARYGTDSQFVTFFFLRTHINNRAEQLFSTFSLVQALVRLTGQKLPDSQERGILCRFDCSGIDWERKIKPENGIGKKNTKDKCHRIKASSFEDEEVNKAMHC